MRKNKINPSFVTAFMSVKASSFPVGTTFDHQIRQRFHNLSYTHKTTLPPGIFIKCKTVQTKWKNADYVNGHFQQNTAVKVPVT